MPPSGFNKSAVKGLLQFLHACYEDLLVEVRSGKHRTFEEAIEAELNRIGKALEKLHIDEEGNVVER